MSDVTENTYVVTLYNREGHTLVMLFTVSLKMECLAINLTLNNLAERNSGSEFKLIPEYLKNPMMKGQFWELSRLRRDH